MHAPSSASPDDASTSIHAMLRTGILYQYPTPTALDETHKDTPAPM